MAVTYYTADLVRALPDDGQRHEVVRGELLVTPAPRRLHQRTVTRLVAVRNRYLEAPPVCAPAEVAELLDACLTGPRENQGVPSGRHSCGCSPPSQS